MKRLMAIGVACFAIASSSLVASAAGHHPTCQVNGCYQEDCFANGICGEDCFVDENGDGICDNHCYTDEDCDNVCDYFVDADEDGFCDHCHDHGKPVVQTTSVSRSTQSSYYRSSGHHGHHGHHGCHR